MMVMVTPVVTGMVVVMVVVLNCDGQGHSSCDRDGGSGVGVDCDGHGNSSCVRDGGSDGAVGGVKL